MTTIDPEDSENIGGVIRHDASHAPWSPLLWRVFGVRTVCSLDGVVVTRPPATTQMIHGFVKAGLLDISSCQKKYAASSLRPKNTKGMDSIHGGLLPHSVIQSLFCEHDMETIMALVKTRSQICFSVFNRFVALVLAD